MGTQVRSPWPSLVMMREGIRCQQSGWAGGGLLPWPEEELGPVVTQTSLFSSMSFFEARAGQGCQLTFEFAHFQSGLPV